MADILRIEISSEEAMRQFGAKLAKYCLKPAIIYLYGNLGAGKTVLVRGFLQGLNYHGTVKSPTYNIVEPYQFDDFVLFHFDFYRILEIQELEYIGIQDYFSQDAICLIEWPSKGVGLLPPADLACYIEIKDSAREIKIIAHTQAGQKILTRLQDEK